MTATPALASVVLSFRNEAENIPILISRLAAMFAGQALEYELVFVNDDSTDASLATLLDERARKPRRLSHRKMARPTCEACRAGIGYRHREKRRRRYA